MSVYGYLFCPYKGTTCTLSLWFIIILYSLRRTFLLLTEEVFLAWLDCFLVLSLYVVGGYCEISRITKQVLRLVVILIIIIDTSR